MAEAVNFPEQNSVISGGGEVADLPAFRDGQTTISCWMLSPAEVVEIVATGRLWISVASPNHPPMRVGSEYPFEKVQN